MSEVNGADSLGQPAGSGVEEITAGQLLRNAREAAGLHVAALAVSMKVPVRKLEALESDRLDLLHDAVFVRALASSVCRTLKIDAAPILSRLPGNIVPRLNPDERGINAPFRVSGQGSRVSASNLLSKPVFLIVGVLLIGAVVVGFFPDIKVPEPVVVAVGTKSTDVDVAFPATSTTSLEVKAPPESGTASSPLVTPEEKAPSVMPTASEAGHGSGSGSGALGSDRLVVFKARGTSWVKVVDANGVVQLSKTLSDGESATASGPVPLSVVVGRVDVTDVEVRGKAFDLVGIARENVARFEVK